MPGAAPAGPGGRADPRAGPPLRPPAAARALGRLRVLRLEPGVPGDRLLVFLPGFMSSAASYRSLLEPLTAEGISVVVPQLYRRGVAALTGRATVE